MSSRLYTAADNHLKARLGIVVALVDTTQPLLSVAFVARLRWKREATDIVVAPLFRRGHNLCGCGLATGCRLCGCNFSFLGAREAEVRSTNGG